MMNATGFDPSGLLSGLRRLDTLLSLAVAQVPAVHGAQAALDRFRGLYIDPHDVDRLLGRAPGAPLFAPLPADPDAGSTPAPESADETVPTRLRWLAAAYGLSAFDVDVLVLALAPEIDSRYDRLYGYLQDDVTRRRPTVDLALNLLCRDAADALARRWHFSPDGPLVREQLIELVRDPSQPAATLLSCGLRADEQVINLLLEQEVLDSRLAQFSRFALPAGGPAAAHAELVDRLARLVSRSHERGTPFCIELVGPTGSGTEDIAERLACAAGGELLRVDLAQLLAHGSDPQVALRRAARQAWFRNAALQLAAAEALIDGPDALPRVDLGRALADFSGLVVITTERRLPAGSLPLDSLRIDVPVPPPAVRRRLWRAALQAGGAAPPAAVLDTLANRFRLTPRQVEAAARAAQAHAGLESDDGSAASPPPRILFAAAAGQTGAALERLASRSRPATPWSALVLPPDASAQLRELCDRAVHNQRVLDEWGFGPRLTRGRGVNALFAGPSGTGKTMAAEIVAAELGVDLWRIELAGVVSKYIGETEKNLDRIFDAAASASGILFFDEAEALFGKRSEVRDSHDRYANLEIAYLLQKMEQFDGVAILATNLRGNLDDAFVRRLAFSVHFPFPDEASRRRIWSGIFPGSAPVATDVDLDLLAHVVQLSGGHISNIALAASFLAAADGGCVTMRHLLEATRREYQKLGKTVDTVALAAGEVR